MTYRLVVYLFLFMLNVKNLFTQNKGKYQYLWALGHPFAAIKVKKIYKRNYYIYQEIKQKKILDTIENGGQLDAFRHSFFMACFAQKIKAQKLIRLGIAHEKDDLWLYRKKRQAEYTDIPDSASIQMDLYNNEAGIQLGKRYKHLPAIQLRDTLIHYIKKGNLKTIR